MGLCPLQASLDWPGGLPLRGTGFAGENPIPRKLFEKSFQHFCFAKAALWASDLPVGAQTKTLKEPRICAVLGIWSGAIIAFEIIQKSVRMHAFYQSFGQAFSKACGVWGNAPRFYSHSQAKAKEF